MNRPNSGSLMLQARCGSGRTQYRRSWTVARAAASRTISNSDSSMARSSVFADELLLLLAILPETNSRERNRSRCRPGGWYSWRAFKGSRTAKLRYPCGRDESSAIVSLRQSQKRRDLSQAQVDKEVERIIYSASGRLVESTVPIFKSFAENGVYRTLRKLLKKRTNAPAETLRLVTGQVSKFSQTQFATAIRESMYNSRASDQSLGAQDHE
ncbi:hypothetical protein B0H19DRAFT_290298 [Mycena capillaripes]|nr:hypothetical protein B0H19DRAFT_290298 [Mycena capillaripes]